jgi:hypothetical protein
MPCNNYLLIVVVERRILFHDFPDLVDLGLRRLAYSAALERSRRLRNLGVLGGIEDDRRLETAEAKTTQRYASSALVHPAALAASSHRSSAL